MKTATEPCPSIFVTVVAWIFIVFSSLAAVAALIEIVLINAMFPLKEIQQAVLTPHENPVPLAAQIIFGHIQFIFGAVLALIVTLLLSSIGMLKRKNWGRTLFIFFMSLAVILNLAELAYQFFYFITPGALQAPANAPPQFAARFESALRIIVAITLVTTLGFTVLFAWIIKRLVSEEVKEEFGVYTYE